jgi:Cys-tRNA(Pro)/Cys-tRNA(Cys) deacylase
MTANNVTRMLDGRKIVYKAFDLPSEKIGATESARLLGVPAGQVFKSIVITRLKPGKPVLAIIPGDREVDLKSAAAVLGEKKVQAATLKEAEQLTGLLAGGISPLALLNRGFQFLLDESVHQFSEIHISGGQRGLNIRLKVSDLVALTNPRLAKISLDVVEEN